MSYTAQHGEDKWIESHWNELGLPEDGVFAEVGACDGLLLSNTYWLEKVKGWSGLLVEPEPRWNFNPYSRPKSTYVKCACGTEDTLSICQHSQCPSLSGALRDGFPRVAVECNGLSVLLNDNGFIDLDVLSIDTEGTEIDVWRSLDLRFHKPKLVIVEWNTQGLAVEDRRAEIISELNKSGYNLRDTIACNLLFVPKHDKVGT